MRLFENWADLRLQLVWVYDGPVSPYYARCLYIESPTTAWFIRKGSVVLTFGENRDRYEEGAWVFPCAQEGWQEFSDDAEILSVRFLAAWPTGEPLFDRSKTVTISLEAGGDLLRISTRLARLIERNFPGVRTELGKMSGTPGRYFELQRFFNEWMQIYSETMEKRGFAPNSVGQVDERVRKALHLMETQTLNHPVRESVLAERVGLSISQINRLFVRDVGKTPAEYWEERRAVAAQKALMRSKQSIKSVAYDLGFSSLPHFSRWVKKRFGISPKELRTSRQNTAIP